MIITTGNGSSSSSDSVEVPAWLKERVGRPGRLLPVVEVVEGTKKRTRKAAEVVDHAIREMKGELFYELLKMMGWEE